MKIILLIDFGSTYTKIRAIDLEKEEVIGSSQAPSTVGSDMTIGLQVAYNKLLVQTGINRADVEKVMACSSAAGGLRMVAIGLVPKLTSEAALRTALGAGARVVKTYSFELSHKEVEELTQINPDIVLLAGGTDGGNSSVIIHNAKMLANSSLPCPIVVAGNKVVAEEVELILKNSERLVRVTENVMPEIGRLNIEPARQVIREVFMQRIVHGKGLDKAKEFAGDIIMPTPMAVLKGAALLALGTSYEKGCGDLIVVDIGGATTDIASLSEGNSSNPYVVSKGLPEPYAKRTVEGDLGIRYNASHILDTIGEKKLIENMKVSNKELLLEMDEEELKSKVRFLSDCIGYVPQDKVDFFIDIALARSAAEIAMWRHAGTMESVYTASGMICLQYGKDLTGVDLVIGTGGIFSYQQKAAGWILAGTRYDEHEALSLRPKEPEFFVDEQYIFYAIGLLSEIVPDKALRIVKKYLKKVACKVQ